MLDYKGEIIYPGQNAYYGSFNIRASETPVNLSLDGEVGFDEFSLLGETAHSFMKETANLETIPKKMSD